MKLRLKRNRGALLLGLLVIILAVVVIGIVAYAIFKALSRWQPRQINPDDVAQWEQSASIEIQQDPSAHILSDGTIVQPLGSVTQTAVVTVERSTNLVDWEAVATISSDQEEALVVTNDVRLPAIFYRAR